MQETTSFCFSTESWNTILLCYAKDLYTMAMKKYE